jgi:hypothetical protein
MAFGQSGSGWKPGWRFVIEALGYTPGWSGRSQTPGLTEAPNTDEDDEDTETEDDTE